VITAVEIRRKGESLYPAFLRTLLSGASFFPKVIRADKSLSDDFTTMRRELSEVIGLSKERTGYGYTIHYQRVKTRKHTEQDLPTAICFETESDYVRFLRKEIEVERFKEDVAYILAELPSLDEWLMQNPLKVIEYNGKWLGLMAVCTYFIRNPKPGLYLRELPIPVHTKFIEQQKGIVRSLLEFLISDAVNTEETLFEKRFNLKFSEQLVRIRILDDSLATRMFSGLSDLSIPETQFRGMTIACGRVLIVENLMNFLAMPNLPDAVCIWGGGFKVNFLRNCHWLKEKRIGYWGDIDPHGLQILSQLRGFFPHSEAIMMDFATLRHFEKEVGPGERTNASTLVHLTEEELELFEYVQSNKLRLEQEKIFHQYVLEKLAAVCLFNIQQQSFNGRKS